VTGLEWFAFVILPVAVVALGGFACGMALRLRLEEDRPGQKFSAGERGGPAGGGSGVARQMITGARRAWKTGGPD
jgi:hypothetical protein